MVGVQVRVRDSSLIPWLGLQHSTEGGTRDAFVISVAWVRLPNLSLGFAPGVGCLFCSCSHAATPPGCAFLIRRNSEPAAFTQSLHTTIRTHKTARWRHTDHMFACVALLVSATPDLLDFPQSSSAVCDVVGCSLVQPPNRVVCLACAIRVEWPSYHHRSCSVFSHF